MVARIASLAFPVSLGCFVATEVFAYAMRLDHVLGVPVYRHGIIAVYAPWQIAQWAWWWGSISPVQFLWPGMLGLAAGLWVWTQTQQQKTRKPQARWATLRELRHAECLGKTGVVLGIVHGRVLRYHGPGHVFFIGRTRSGKTTQLLSTLLEYPHSILVNDVKSELYALSAGYRATVGRIMRLCPTDSASQHYNPWEAVRIGTDAAYRDVEILSHYLVRTEGARRDSTAIHFQTLATKVLNGVFLYGLTTGLATCGEDFNDLLTLTPWAGLLQSMKEHDHPEVQRAAELASRPQREELGSLQTTIANALSIFSDPRVALMTRESHFRLAALREDDAPCTVYWQVPFSDQVRLRPLTRLVMHQMLDHCTQRLTGWKHPILVVLEELPSLDHFPLASSGLNYFAGYQVQLLNLTPSMPELLDHYGRYHNFLVGSHVQCLFGLNDAETAQAFATRLGTREVSHRRVSVTQGRRTTSDDIRDEALLNATGLLQMEDDGVLILAGRHAVCGTQARFYQHRIWRRRSQLSVPTKEA